MVCRKCKTRNYNTPFCRGCGQVLTDNAGRPKKKSKKNRAAIISVSLALIAAAGACASAWYFAAACFAQSEQYEGYVDCIPDIQEKDSGTLSTDYNTLASVNYDKKINC